jgi:hypothetical protein
MTQRFAKAWRQAHAIGHQKTPKGKANAIHVWATLVKEAMRGVPVSSVQSESESDLEPGPRDPVRGEMAGEPEPDSAPHPSDGARRPGPPR